MFVLFRRRNKNPQQSEGEQAVPHGHQRHDGCHGVHGKALPGAGREKARRLLNHSEGGGDTVGSPRRARISQFELFELILLSKLDRRYPVEQLEATVSQSTVPSPLLIMVKETLKRGQVKELQDKLRRE